jgi:hypothetical protein
LDHELEDDDDDENPAFPVDEIPPPAVVSPELVEDMLQADPYNVIPPPSPEIIAEILEAEQDPSWIDHELEDDEEEPASHVDEIPPPPVASPELVEDMLQADPYNVIPPPDPQFTPEVIAEILAAQQYWLDHELEDDDDEDPAFPVDEIPQPPLVSPALVEDLLQAQPDPSLVDHDLDVDDVPISPESIHIHPIMTVQQPIPPVQEPILPVEEHVPTITDPHLPIEEPLPPRIEIPEPALDALPVDGGVPVAPPVTAPLRRSPRLATIPKVCYKRFYRLRP